MPPKFLQPLNSSTSAAPAATAVEREAVGWLCMPFISDSAGTTLLFSVWRQSWAQLSHLRLCLHFYTVCLIAATLLSRKGESAEGADSLRESPGRFLRAKPNAGFQLKAAFMGNMELDSRLGWKLLQGLGAKFTQECECSWALPGKWGWNVLHLFGQAFAYHRACEVCLRCHGHLLVSVFSSCPFLLTFLKGFRFFP